MDVIFFERVFLFGVRFFFLGGEGMLYFLFLMRFLF